MSKIDPFITTFRIPSALKTIPLVYPALQWRTQEFCSGWGWGCVQQIQLKTEDRENGDLGALAP